MRAWVALLAVVISPSASAMTLLCEGDGWQKIGDPFPHSLVLTLDTQKSHVSVQTFGGIATGELTAKWDNYYSTLRSQSGIIYELILNRYSGDLTLSIDNPGAKIQRVEFLGKCKRQEPLF